MLEIAAELAMTDEDYADMALKFTEQFLWIASAMGHMGGGDTGMWDEEDGFVSTTCCGLPNGQAQRLKVRSMVGLLPLCAATVFDGELIKKYPELGERLKWFLETRPSVRRDSRSRQRAALPVASSLPSWTKPSFAACWPKCSTRTSF